MGIVVPVSVVAFLSVFVLYCFVQRRKKRQTHEDEGINIVLNIVVNHLNIRQREYNMIYLVAKDFLFLWIILLLTK